MKNEYVVESRMMKINAKLLRQLDFLSMVLSPEYDCVLISFCAVKQITKRTLKLAIEIKTDFKDNRLQLTQTKTEAATRLIVLFHCIMGRRGDFAQLL